jgi:ABC-type multidrug transport system permease subunit
MALTPIALIPQVVLGGLMVPATTVPHLKWLMYIIPARWGFESAVVPERHALEQDPSWLIDLQMQSSQAGYNSPNDFIEAGKFKCSIAQVASDSLAGGWGFTTYDSPWIPFAFQGATVLGLLVMLMIILKRRDPV